MVDFVQESQYKGGQSELKGSRVNAQRAILTVDLGTTYFKACLFDDQGELRGAARVAPPLTHTRSDRWELAAEAFLTTLQAAVGQTLQACPDLRDKVAALAFATQANSFTLLDKHQRPLLPFVLWPDERAAGAPGGMQLMQALLAHRAVTGVPEVGPTFMAAKLHFLLSSDAALRAQACEVRLLSDYWVEWLTGSAATEGGVAGLSALSDIRTLAWIPQACHAAGLAGVTLPPIVRAGTDLGPLRPEAAQALGLPISCRAVMGALDQYTGAIGVGNVAPGRVSETTGTVLAVVHCASALADTPQPFFQGPAWAADRFYRMSFGSVSANLLEWYQKGLADRPSYAALDALAAAAPAGAGGLSLKNDALARTVADGFEGPASARSRANETRCILETVARSLDQHIRVLGGDARPHEIHCAGGGARSDIWLQIKADISGIPMTALHCVEPTSLGAAMLAARALGWGELDELARTWVRPRRTFQPGKGGA